ncbi:MAG: M28 family peptidase [Flavobacteriales bacterium]|nr:M28 family peptidase [Flavobacteriales bacterium]
MRQLLFAIFFTLTFPLFSQQFDYAKKVVDTLTSPFFSGRGALNNGEHKAAEYLAKEFRRLGLKNYGEDYFQEFSYPINTFPGKVELKVGEKQLIPGVDFIVGPASGSINGTYETVWYNASNAPTKKQLKKLAGRRFFSKKVIVVDDAGEAGEEVKEVLHLLKINVYGAAGVIILDDKLTQSLSPTYNDFAIVHVKRGVIERIERSIAIHIDQDRITNYTSQNVIGYVQGTDYPDSVIILSAHYDHLGMMGDEVYFPGANDNASGIAMLLNLAYHYTHKEPPKKTLVFIAFGGEEAGLRGSKYYVEHPLIPLRRVNFVMNMDLMGTGDEGAMIVNAKVFPRQFQVLDSINNTSEYLVQLKQRGKAANSDHYWFSEKGVPAFFIYTLGGIKAYHDVEDVARTLPYTDFEDCFRLIRDFVDEL